jgi:Domain of unknown function (DUF5117)
MWLEINKWDTEFLFLDSLQAGVGSNDIGLDRGQVGEGRVVKFDRVGPKVLLTQVNYGFRATTNNAAEREAVKDAFAQSVIWGFEAGALEVDVVLVDATAFYLQDTHHASPSAEFTALPSPIPACMSPASVTRELHTDFSLLWARLNQGRLWEG